MPLPQGGRGWRRGKATHPTLLGVKLNPHDFCAPLCLDVFVVEIRFFSVGSLALLLRCGRPDIGYPHQTTGNPLYLRRLIPVWLRQNEEHGAWEFEHYSMEL